MNWSYNATESTFDKLVRSKIAEWFAGHTRPQFDAEIPTDGHNKFTTGIGHAVTDTTSMSL